MKQLLDGSAAKTLVAVGQVIVIILGAYFASDKWEPGTVAAIGAVFVYLVPNAKTPSGPGPGRPLSRARGLAIAAPRLATCQAPAGQP